MKIEKFKIGNTFETFEGTATIIGFNGNIVDCKLEIIDYAEDENGNLDYNKEMIKTEERRWTCNEIAEELKKIDGENYKVFIED